MASNRYTKDVVNSRVGQDELIELQVELFAAAREALASARGSGTIPSSLLTSCHQIIRDSGMVADAQGVGEASDAERAALDMGVSANWLADAADMIDGMDLDDVVKS